LTTGISGAGDYAAGLGEFIKKSGVDEGALRIRCSISSYTTGDLLQACEQVTFCDRDIPNVLQVSRSYELIDRCDTVLIGGQAQSLSAEGKATLKKQWHRAIESHSVPLIFAISFGSSEVQALCFAGMLMLKEGIDPHAKQNAAYLEKAGCKVISFSGATEAPSMPLYALEQIAISKQEFVKRKLPLIYRLGQISCYADFSEEDICLLIDEIHRRKQKVFVVGFTQSACAIAKRADGLIACSSIQPRTKRYWDTELSVSELEGQHYSMSCSQMVKQQADCLIPRPSNGRGGLSSLVTLVGRIKEAYRNFSDYVRYLISVSIMRILVVSIPMLFGKTILDARHVLFFGCLMDSVALLMFVCRKKSIPSNSKNYISVRRVSEYFFGDAPMLLAGIAAGVSVFLAPELLGLLSFAGLYHDKTEYSFVALIFLHILSFFLIYAGPHIKNSVKNKILWGEIALLLVFLILCFVWKPFGGFFGIESLPPFPYLLLTLFPSLVYGCVMLLLSRRRKR